MEKNLFPWGRGPDFIEEGVSGQLGGERVTENFTMELSGKLCCGNGAVRSQPLGFQGKLPIGRCCMILIAWLKKPAERSIVLGEVTLPLVTLQILLLGKHFLVPAAWDKYASITSRIKKSEYEEVIDSVTNNTISKLLSNIYTHIQEFIYFSNKYIDTYGYQYIFHTYSIFPCLHISIHLHIYEINIYIFIYI